MIHELFPDIEIPDAILAHGFGTGEVWGNDACVRLTRGEWSLWVDHVDPGKRECHGARFILQRHDECLQCFGEWYGYETESEILAHIERGIS